eukprot:gene3317-3918_t
MKYATASIALAIAALAAGHAQAADVGKTREQVRAELAQAQRNGDIVANTDAGSSEYRSGKGSKLSAAFPESYAQPAVAGDIILINGIEEIGIGFVNQHALQ